MHNVHDFIEWAKGSVNKWHYLFGSVRVRTDKTTLDRYYINHYSESMTRAQYDALTRNWRPTDYATDCQGLLDAYLTYECGERTDANANGNYKNWCTDKGRIKDIDRPYVVGEALFMARTNGTMHHVGWVCGFDDSGEPLVVEARGIAYGVVITKFSKRSWTHRGLMTKKFDYKEETPMEKIKFEIASPMHKGDAYLKMQQALNAAGYTDANGKRLEEDGKWGKCSQAAFDALIADYKADEPQVIEFKAATPDGGYEMRAVVARVQR